MSFYFVDRIFDITEFKSAQGIKNVTKSENFLYTTPKLGRFLNPAIISEAVMQLASWLIVYSSDFTRKPVILRIDRCDYPSLVRPGDQITLEVTIKSREDDLFLVDAKATVGERTVLVASDCHAYALPLGELDDPAVIRKQFAAIHRPEFKNVTRVANQETIPIPNTPGCTFYMIDKIQALHSEKQIQALKQFSYAEDFFKEHFPRKPVVPGVLQLTLVGETAQALASHRNPRALLEPKYIAGGRLRKYILPGSECIATAQLKSGDFNVDGAPIVIAGSITCEGTKVMQVDIGFTNHIV